LPLLAHMLGRSVPGIQDGAKLMTDRKNQVLERATRPGLTSKRGADMARNGVHEGTEQV